MDPKTTSPAKNDPLAAMFQNITIDQAEKNQCVTEEKISNSSNAPNENNSPLKGTEIQAPLTTPDDDYTPLPTTISVTLPRELLERILLLLDAESILTCRLVNREFNEIIQSSTLLQYILACEEAGVIDNPQSPHSYAERLEALKRREEAWRKLKPAFEMMIRVNHRAASKICRKTEGVYFLSDDNLKDLNYCHFTSFPQDNPQWIRIPGHGPALNWSGTLVDSVAALYEHDLIVNLISSDVGNQADMERYSLDFVLLKFSTGEYHPLAHRPRIHVQRSSEVEPWIVSRIVGNNLALVVHIRDGTFFDKLFIFDWKTGRKLLEHDADEDTYVTLDFISPELLLVPNLSLSHFEVWHIPTSHHNAVHPVQILSLQIPVVSPGYSLLNFDCRADPNLYLHSMPYLPPRPFFSSPENSIVVVRLRLSPNSFSLGHRSELYNLIMHRRALLATIQKWASPSLLEQQGDTATCLTNEVTMHKSADPEGRSVRPDYAQSKLVSINPGPSTRTRDPLTFGSSSHPSTDSGSSGLSLISSTPRCIQVPWAKWGPPISRWFQVNEAQGQWLGHSNGQRYTFSDPNPHDPMKLMVSVADFNPHNFRRNLDMTTRPRSGEVEDNRNNGNNEEGKVEEEEGEFEILDHKGVFSEEVYMGLKCVVYRAPDEYDFDVVLMDEQRLFGVKLNREGKVGSVKVLYIG